MFHLYFIRSTQTFATESYYERNTDVWVFGDSEGFLYFIHSLSEAATSKLPITLGALDFSSNTMRVLILPPVVLSTSMPRLKFLERVVKTQEGPKMELVIYGNSEGYNYLTQTFQEQIDNPENDFSYHSHLDCLDKTLVQRSVSLNVRCAIPKWDRKQLVSYEAMIFDPSDLLLPEDAEISAWEYTEIDPNQDPYYLLE